MARRSSAHSIRPHRYHFSVVDIAVAIESGTSKTFARAIEWPGWCRSGKAIEGALAELDRYASRYARVAATAQIEFPGDGLTFTIVEELPGNVTTDFGAPGITFADDLVPLSGVERSQWMALLHASWAEFDRTVMASSETLAKGPRGGGRDLTKLVDHVLEAERAYVPKLGIRVPKVVRGDDPQIASNRLAILVAIENDSLARQWPLRYWIGRTAWHLLDHAWEIEDKQTE